MTTLPGKVNVTNTGEVNLENDGEVNVFGTTQEIIGEPNELQYNNAGIITGSSGLTTDGSNMFMGLLEFNIGTSEFLTISHNGTTGLIQQTSGDVNFSAGFTNVFRVTNNFIITNDTDTVFELDTSTTEMNIDNDVTADVIRGSGTGPGKERYIMNNLLGAGDVVINTATFATVATINYTPISNNSKLRLCFDGYYDISASNDPELLYEARFIVNGISVDLPKSQSFRNLVGGTGTSSSVLAPFYATYVNTTSSTKTIQYQARRVLGSSTLTFDRNIMAFISVIETPI